MRNNSDFIDTFASFGESFAFNGNLFPNIQKFVCCLYGVKTENVNEARFIKFLSKKKTPEPQQLPPTADALLCHCKRVSYATAVIKRALMRDPGTPGINEEFKWSVKEDVLKVQWLLLPPAPDYVLNLITARVKQDARRNVVHGSRMD